MKRFLCSLLLLITTISKGAVVVWDGGGLDGLWNTASNWSGDAVPGTTDEVILDNSFLTSSYMVSLLPGSITITIQSLTIIPVGATIITLLLPSSNTADPGLFVAGALILNNGAVLKNSSGASTGSGVSIAGVFQINNGGRYIHNTSRGNAAIVSQLSTAAGTAFGIFEYDVPVASYTVSLSNRTYGTFILSANRGTVTYIGSGSNPLHINGDMRINGGVNFSISMTADIIVHGNYSQAASSVFDLQSASGTNFIKMQGDISAGGTITESGSGAPVLELNGTSDQHISMTGILRNSIELKINNAAGITLETALAIPYNLQLASGKVRTTAINILAMADNCIYTGGSTASFIDGPMKKTGDDDFYFPVGKGNIYATLGLAGGVGNSILDEFTVEYIRGNPQTTYGADYETGGFFGNINHISYVEYWNVSRNTGNTASKYMTLKVNCESFCKDFGTLFIAGYNSSQAKWNNAGQTGATPASPVSCPAYLTGTITAGPVDEFSHFTLATNATVADNPLPVKLIFFDVVKSNGEKVTVKWELADYPSATEEFEIQKAGSDQRFRTIATINGSENSRFYFWEDALLNRGVNYYRLKIKNGRNGDSYSRVVIIPGETRDLRLISLLPNLVSSKSILTAVSNQDRELDLRIVDMTGRIVKRRSQYLPAGSTSIILSLDDLPGGIYFLLGISKDGKTNIIRFFKE